MGDAVGIVMAGGLGTRMRSTRPKALHEVAWRPMLYYPVKALLDAGVGRVLVVSAPGDIRARVDRVLADWFEDADVQTVVQPEPLGTAHAALCAEPELRSEKAIVIVNADMPLLRGKTVKALVDRVAGNEADLVIGVAELDDATGFGRVVIGEDGLVERIVEERDATPEEREIKLCNVGVYASRKEGLFHWLREVDNKNAKGEYYLTDVVSIARARGAKVGFMTFADPEEAFGVNNRVQLAYAERVLFRRKLEDLMLSGVTVHLPETVLVDLDAEIGPDTEIWPFVQIGPGTKIGSGCSIGQGCVLYHVTLKDKVTVLPYSVVEDSTVEEGAQVGPFARIRPGCVVGKGSKVGNFVEMKKTHLGDGSKANHLTYLGDCTVGKDVNIGAGTITCNYDGVRKHPTVIEDGAFIGSDTQLVAPVKVGKEAYVGAGTTVTRDVPSGALALSRVPQTHVMGYAERKKAELRQKQEK